MTRVLWMSRLCGNDECLWIELQSTVEVQHVQYTDKPTLRFSSSATFPSQDHLLSLTSLSM